MPNHAVFSVARNMPLDKPALFTAIQHVSHIVRANANDLVNIVTEARHKGATGPELIDVLKKVADLQEADLAKSEAPRKHIQSHIAAVAQTAPIKTNTVLPAIRAPASGFWGRVWHQSLPHQQRNMSTMNIDLALPLPPLTAEIFANTNGTTEASIPERARHTFVPKEERPAADERVDLFIVKQLGGHKRKRPGPEGLSSDQPSSAQGLDPMTNDEIMLDGNEDSESALRLEEKAARKAARKQKKKEKAAEAAALNYSDEPVFDYANAPSVLHAQDATEGKRKGKKDKKKNSGIFDPFKNMHEGPKGLPRTQKEIPGRSRTFQS